MAGTLKKGTCFFDLLFENVYNKILKYLSMQIKLTWKETQDYLLFNAINPDLAQWFVQTGQQLGNHYSTGNQAIDTILRRSSTDKLIQEEINYIETVNKQLALLKMPVVIEMPSNWYDQTQLNKLHKDWGETRQKWPKLTELFYKIDPKVYEAYQEMNCHIHLIEDSFLYGFRDPGHWRVNNPFKDNSYDWETCHLYINYPGHGREAFEKFRNMDTHDDIYRDNVNWDNVDSFIGVHLVRPYKETPPQEFLDWCKEKKLTPHTKILPLGNLVDWELNLTRARQVMTKNVIIKDNYFSLETIE